MKNVVSSMIKSRMQKGFCVFASLFTILFLIANLTVAQCNFALGGYGSSNLPRFDTYQQAMAGGVGVNSANLQFTSNNSTCTGWKLTVRALSPNFSNGTNVVPISFGSLQYNSTTNGGPTPSAIGLNTNPIPLTTTEQVIVQSSNVAINGYFMQTYNLKLLGGAQLLQPSSGIYTVTLLFTLYNSNGVVVSTYQMTNVGFQLYYLGAATSFSVTLQNGGNLADFVFDNPSKLANGISLSKANSLSIYCNSTTKYQVMANTIGSYLTSNTSAHQIPVSVIHLEASPATPINNVTGYTTTLSANNTSNPIIINKSPGYPNETVLYNLRYFINGNEPAIINAPAGTYTGILVFIAIPL